MAKASETFNKYLDQLKEQEWYQQIQGSYQQLPPDQQKILKIGGLSVLGIAFLFFAYSMFSSANTAKNEYYTQQELLMLVNQAGDEMKRLKGQNSGLAQSHTQNWKQHFAGLAGGQGIPPSNIEVTKEAPGASKEILLETLVDVQIKGVQLRPLIQLLYQVEHGGVPMKLRALNIESAANDGNLVARMSVSGFSVKGEAKK